MLVMAASMSESVGRGVYFTRAAAATIMPHWQVAALRDVKLHPGLLQRVRGVGREALDGGDLLRWVKNRLAYVDKGSVR